MGETKRDIECIDVILYINLEHRTDRKEHILNEINKICTVQEKIYRVDAIKHDKGGAIGCGLSHMKALTFALTNENWNNILILEDDFTFRESDFNEISNSVTELVNHDKDFDVLLLAYNDKVNFHCTFNTNSRIVQTHRSLTTSGYIIKKQYIINLIENFNFAVEDMIKNGINEINPIDVGWNSLQNKDKWYSTLPSLGYQYDNYSDIQQCDVKYNL